MQAMLLHLGFIHSIIKEKTGGYSMNRFGFIGVGNMGSAVAKAVVREVGAQNVLVSSRTMEKARQVADSLSCEAADNETLARECRYLVLGVKPQILPGVLTALRPVLEKRSSPCTLVSMAAGLTISRLQELSGVDSVIRIMPNTPVLVGAGVITYAVSDGVSQEEESEVVEAFAQAGRVDRLSEGLIDVASALAGCGPAFVCQFLEGLADGAVACGLPRQKAYLYGAQMFFGTAKLALETELHPGVLKDQVTSPGGSTIQGVRALEKQGLRSAAMEAVIAACEKNKELG